jgi:hypothetical protein
VERVACRHRCAGIYATPDQNLALSDLASRPVVLAFYPADWSPVCGDQMALYNEVLPEFHKYNAEVLGISVDGAWCHEALPGTAICIFRCWPIFIRKGPSQSSTLPIVKAKASVSERCS